MVVRFAFRLARVLLFSVSVVAFLAAMIVALDAEDQLVGDPTRDPSALGLMLLFGFLTAGGVFLLLLGFWTLLVQWSLPGSRRWALAVTRLGLGLVALVALLPLMWLPASMPILNVVVRMGALLAIAGLGLAFLEPTFRRGALKRAR